MQVTDEELKKHLSSAGFVWDAKIVRDNAGNRFVFRITRLLAASQGAI
jgi:hypothetical protein